MKVQQSIRLPSEVGWEPDPELAKVLAIAAHVGALSGDDVNVSYTSLLVGLLWADNLTSRWLQERSEKEDVRLEQIYRHRRIDEDNRDEILKRVEAGEPPDAREDFYSVSARTVLQEAGSVARETGWTQSEPLGVQHVAAVYFFRNPPGHDHQLHQEWGFDTETWRRAFALFVQDSTAEVSSWSQVLSRYLETATEPASVLPGSILGNYVFDDDATKLLRTVESSLSDQEPALFSSERLVQTLAQASSVPDGKLFAEEVAERIGVTEVVELLDASPFGEKGSSYPVTRGLRSILSRARNLARAASATEAVGIRHIIASILVVPDSTAHRILVDSGVSIPFLRQKLLKDLTRRWLADDGVQWRFHLVGRTPPTIAGYNSDAADKGEDKLDVTRYGTAFATIMAAHEVHPPLSIGIFGDWGSGKSFFMRLMRMETDRVCEIAETNEKNERLFCRRVLAIEFNAWHYAETNLLASLVQTIFEELRRAMVGKDGESKLMEEVINKLELTKVARKDAEQRVKSAKGELKRCNDVLTQVREDARRKAEDLDTIKSRDVVAAVRRQVLPPTRMDDALELAETYLGLDGLQKLKDEQERNVGELADLVSDARVVAGRVRSAWGWLARAPVSKQEIGWLIGISIVVLGAGAPLAWLLKDTVADAWPAIATVVVEVGAVLGMVTPWAKRHLRTIASGLDQFDNIRAEVDKKLDDERAKYEKDTQVVEKARDHVAGQLEQARARLGAAKEEVGKAESELRESGSAHRIARLVERRLAGKDYEKYLGIVAAIRNDFGTLSRLMKTMRSEASPAEGDVLLVDRIVLYIDDLDRCPADKVVSVLEAIHLLLAFELFVVVVGVDIRWAARSLHQKYPQHLAAGIYESRASEKKPADEDGASALDYLEKIFQIPFWLPPMDDEASRNMIGELVPPGRDGAQVEESDGGIGGTPQEIQAGAGTAGEAGTSSPSSESQPTPTTEAEALVIEPIERDFMLRLAGAVGKSPRRLKRFVNTYRILKASNDALERETFVVEDGKHGEYRAAMTLLALVTGAPRSALDILQRLSMHEGDLESFEECVRNLDDSAEAEYVMEAMKAYRNAPGDDTPNLRDLQYWGPRVARFSFRSGRM